MSELIDAENKGRLVSAPGKLILSGEWAVLEKGNPALVAAIDRRVYAHVRASGDDKIHLLFKDLGISLSAVFDGERLVVEDHQKIQIMHAAAETACRYLGSITPFHLETWNDQTVIKGEKLGFGSSAAATVAIIASLLRFYGKQIDKNVLFKLAALSHYRAQERIGSGFDIAASVWGGLLVYERFDPVWLQEQMRAKSICSIVAQEWPRLRIEKIMPLEDMKLVVGWTGKSASTSRMVRQMQAWKSGHPESYNKMMNRIAGISRKLILGWKKRDKPAVLAALKKNQQLLSKLSRASRVPILTQKLQRLSAIADQHGAAGKLSGAGGGDCGIALCFGIEKEKIWEAWKKEGITPLAITLDEGVREESI